MDRQGCRNHRALLLFLALASGLIIASPAAAQEREAAKATSPPGNDIGPSGVPASENIDLRLELTWKSDQPRIWAGELRVVGTDGAPSASCSITETQNLTPGVLMSGGISVDENGSLLRFSPPSGHGRLQAMDDGFASVETHAGGIGFRIIGKPSDRISLTLRRDESNDLAAPSEMSLSELATCKTFEQAVAPGCTWTLRRPESDRLRVAMVPADGPNSSGTSLLWDDQQVSILVTTDSVPSKDPTDLELACEVISSSTRSSKLITWPIRLTNGIGRVENPGWSPPKGDMTYQLNWSLRAKHGTHSLMGVPVSSSVAESLTNPMALLRGSEQNRSLAESTTHLVVLQRHPRTAASFQLKPELIGRMESMARSWSVSRMIPKWQANPFSARNKESNRSSKAAIHGKQVVQLGPGGRYSDALPVEAVGKRHRVVVRIPNEHAMKLGIEIQDASEPESSLRTIRDVTVVRTRLRNGNDNWVAVEVDFYPQSNSAVLILENRDPNQNALFESIEVYSLKQTHPIPSAVTEQFEAQKGKLRTALVHMDMSMWFDLGRDINALHAPTNAAITKRADLLIAANQMIESIRNCGFGGAVLTVSANGRSLYPTKAMSPDVTAAANNPIASDRSPETFEMLLRMFDREGLKLVPCIAPNFPLTHLEQEIKSAVLSGKTGGAGIALMSPWTGQASDLNLANSDSLHVGLYNPASELVSHQIVSLFTELAAHCEGHACVDAIGVINDEGSSLRIPTASSMMDSITLDRLDAELPSPEVARSQRLAWVRGDGSSQFEQWRIGKVSTIYSAILQSLGERPLFAFSTINQPDIEVANRVNDQRLVLSQLYRQSCLEPLASRCKNEITNGATANHTPSNIAARLAAGFYYVPQSSVATTADESIAKLEGRATIPLLDSPTAQQLLPRLLGRSDRCQLVVSDHALVHWSPSQRLSIERFQSLPSTMMSDIVPSDEAMKFVKLRYVQDQGTSFLVAVNLSQWNVNIDVATAGVDEWHSLLATEPAPEIASGVWRATLEPGELVGLRSSAPLKEISNPVIAWSAQIAGDEHQIAAIGKVVRDIAEGIALFTEPNRFHCIENSGFEAKPAPTPDVVQAVATGKVASSPVNVAGWIVAQYPSGCVAIDDTVSLEGSASIRLSNRASHSSGTWIMTRAIAVPETGRLAVSLRARGAPTEDSSKSEPIMLRIAIESTVAGTAMRQSRVVKVPRDGQWSVVPYRVEIDALPRHGIDTLRLAIDVLSEGTVWIDEVLAEDSFMTESEKAALQGQLFLALDGVAKGELSNAVKLLDSHWVQQMIALPAYPQRPSVLPASSSSDDPAVEGASRKNKSQESPSATPGVADRLRSWLPKKLRF